MGQMSTQGKAAKLMQAVPLEIEIIEMGNAEGFNHCGGI
jgi:hypothetical protein